MLLRPPLLTHRSNFGFSRETRIFRSRNSRNSHMAPPILSLALPADTGRVLSIQSHTVQGYVGNKSAVFPLQLLGYDVDPINSVQFSNHTGNLSRLWPDIWCDAICQSEKGVSGTVSTAHDDAELITECVGRDMSLGVVRQSSKYTPSLGYPTFKGQVLNGQQLWDLIEGLEGNELLFYTHLLTGYIGSESFLNTVLQVVSKLRSKNPELTYVCDPVMGDEGKLYVPEELVSVYREKVVPVASMLTPNQFEAELLTGFKIQSEEHGREACRFLHAAGPSKVVITSINIAGSLLLIGSHQKEKGEPSKQFKIVFPKIPAYFTGTGDLMTALLLGWSNKYPDNLEIAAELAVSTLQAVLHRTLSDYERVGHDSSSTSLEIRLIQSQDDIRSPQVKLKAEIYS